MNKVIKMSQQDQNNHAFSMIADIEGDYTDILQFSLPDEVGVLPVRNLVLFPGVVSPILIGRKPSLELVKRAEQGVDPIAVFTQKYPDVEDPQFDDLTLIAIKKN